VIFSVKIKLLSINGTGMRGRRRISSLISTSMGGWLSEFSRELGFFIWNQARESEREKKRNEDRRKEMKKKKRKKSKKYYFNDIGKDKGKLLWSVFV
jgi:hypothetical protein